MSDRTCAHPDCESAVPTSQGRGRPRKFCLIHGHRRTASYQPELWSGPLVQKRCPGCRVAFVPWTDSQEFCSRSCREKRGGPPCYICGEGTARGGLGRSLSGKAKHNACFEHGTESGYSKHGCRCSECRAANAKARAHYRRKRAAEGRPLHLARKTIVRTCPGCNETFGARADHVQSGQGVYCSRRCKTLTETGVDIDSPDWVPPNRFRINAKIRAAIYERDGFTCWLCGDPVKPDADTLSDWYPSLDHVIPRSRGGSDNPENLRCAHRLCNSIKGSKEVADALANRDLAMAV